MQRSSPRSRKQQEEWHSNYRYQIERQEQHELRDLSEGEGGVDGGCGGLSEHLDCVTAVLVEDSNGRDEVDVSLADQCCLLHTSQSSSCTQTLPHSQRADTHIKNIHTRLIHQKSLEQQRNHYLSFSQHEKHRADPSSWSMEDQEESDLREVCEHEQQDQDQDGGYGERDQPFVEERPVFAVSDEVEDALQRVDGGV